MEKIEEPGYEWLEQILENWIEEEYEDIDPSWIREDGMLDFVKVAERLEEEKHNVDADEVREFLEHHVDIIDWAEFDEW